MGQLGLLGVEMSLPGDDVLFESDVKHPLIPGFVPLLFGLDIESEYLLLHLLHLLVVHQTFPLTHPTHSTARPVLDPDALYLRHLLLPTPTPLALHAPQPISSSPVVGKDILAAVIFSDGREESAFGGVDLGLVSLGAVTTLHVFKYINRVIKIIESTQMQPS